MIFILLVSECSSHSLCVFVSRSKQCLNATILYEFPLKMTVISEYYHHETQIANTAHSCYYANQISRIPYVVFIERHWYLVIQHVVNAL